MKLESVIHKEYRMECCSIEKEEKKSENSYKKKGLNNKKIVCIHSKLCKSK